MKNPDSQHAPQTHKPSVSKRLGMGAFTVSLLVHGIFAVIAVFFLYQWVYPPDPEITFVPPGGGSKGGPPSSTIHIQRTQLPASIARPAIRFDGMSDVTLPDSAAEMMNSSMPVSMANLGGNSTDRGNRNGTGIGENNGPGNGPGFVPNIGKGFMTPFGSADAMGSGMAGHFYDFKQLPDGKSTPGYQTSRYTDFTSRVTKIQNAGFRDTSFKAYFKAPDTLYLTQLAIPTTDADAGPKFFNVADKVKPSGWLVHYHGTVSVNRDITFRFVGTGDDYVSVFSNGRPRLIAAWPSQRAQVIGRWKPSATIDESAVSPIPGGPLVKGDWITLRKGAPLDLDIAAGECPGGKVGFVLMVEEKNTKYQTASNGALVLPLFTTEPVSQDSRERITKGFPQWEFDWENVPVFKVSKTAGTDWSF